MIDTGWCLFLSASSSVSVPARFSWVDPDNAKADDSSAAVCTIDEDLVGPPWDSFSETLKLTDPDFPFAIGAAASYSVSYRIRRSASGGGHYIAAESIRPIVNGVIDGNNVANRHAKWAATLTEDFTGPWGIAWEKYMFNSNLGLAIEVHNEANDGVARVEAVWIRVEYTPITVQANEMPQYN